MQHVPLSRLLCWCWHDMLGAPAALRGNQLIGCSLDELMLAAQVRVSAQHAATHVHAEVAEFVVVSPARRHHEGRHLVVSLIHDDEVASGHQPRACSFDACRPWAVQDGHGEGQGPLGEGGCASNDVAAGCCRRSRHAVAAANLRDQTEPLTLEQSAILVVAV